MRCSTRTLCSLGFVVIFAMAAGNLHELTAGQTSESSAQPVASLKDQLEKGLRARRNVEIQFVARVAQLVDQGLLSKEFVQGTFTYTLKKYRHRTKSLVPYFEQVLRQRATKDGNTALNNVVTTLPAL
jgi:hypothetical protein